MAASGYAPNYSLTPAMLGLVDEISGLAGPIDAGGGLEAHPRLRRAGRIRSIHSSLAIESSALSLDQVAGVVEGRKVSGRPEEIREAKNAAKAYSALDGLDPFSLPDLLRAHGLMTSSLIGESGRLRSRGVGVFKGTRAVHVAPPAHLLPSLVGGLMEWAARSDAHPLVKSGVVHYEMEFIHPFADGNGRIGRLWHTLILSRWRPFFAWLPLESSIFKRRQQYYDRLNEAGRSGDCTAFVEFTLQAVLSSLAELDHSIRVEASITPGIGRLLEILGEGELPARELAAGLGLRHRQWLAESHLKPALALGLIEMTIPDKPNSRNQRYRRTRPPENP